MTTIKENIERVTITGRFSEGDSDIVAQGKLVEMGCRIVAFKTSDGGNVFEVIGERAMELGY